MKADGTKFSFDDLDFPAELESSMLEFVRNCSCCMAYIVVLAC